MGTALVAVTSIVPTPCDTVLKRYDGIAWRKFCSAWRGTVPVLVARGRAQVGVHAAKSDWSKRIRDFQFME